MECNRGVEELESVFQWVFLVTSTPVCGECRPRTVDAITKLYLDYVVKVMSLSWLKHSIFPSGGRISLFIP